MQKSNDDDDPVVAEIGETNSVPAPLRKRKENWTNLVAGAFLVLLIAGGIAAYLAWPKTEKNQSQDQNQTKPDNPFRDMPLVALNIIPVNAPGFVSIRVNDLLHSNAGNDIVKELHTAKLFDEFKRMAGKPPNEVERFTLAFLEEDPGKFVYVVTSTTEISREVLNTLVPDGKPEKFQSRDYMADGRNAFGLVNPIVYAFARRATMRQFLKRVPGPNAKGPLRFALERARENTHLAAGFVPSSTALEKTRQWLESEVGKPLRPLLPLLSLQAAALTGQFDKQSTFQLHLRFSGKNKARDAMASAKAGLTMCRERLPDLQKILADFLGAQSADTYIKTLENSLPKATVKQDSATLQIQWTIKTDWTRITADLLRLWKNYKE